MPTVIVYWSPGRTEEQNQRVARRMAQALVEDGGARAEDVLIIFQHIEAGNAARGRDLLGPGASRPPSQLPRTIPSNHVAHDIVMPNVGFDTQSASLVEWLKQPGEPIQKGEAIAVIETDKADVELESIAAGVVLEMLYQPGDEVPVGAVIARVGSADEYQQPISTAAANAVSPVAARIAQANTLDLAAIDGSGPRGRVMRQDVEQHLARQPGESVHLGALPKVRRALRQAGLTLEQVHEQTRRSLITMQDVQAVLAQQTPAADAAPDVCRYLPPNSPLARAKSRSAECGRPSGGSSSRANARLRTFTSAANSIWKQSCSGSARSPP